MQQNFVIEPRISTLFSIAIAAVYIDFEMMCQLFNPLFPKNLTSKCMYKSSCCSSMYIQKA